MTGVLAIVASPAPGGRTATAAAAVLAGAEAAGATTRLLELAGTDTEDALAAIEDADAIVFGSPVYRAAHTALLQSLLEATQRGRHGETSAPLRGKAAAVLLTGASGHHFLATEGLRALLSSFFAVQVLSPSLYLDSDAFTPGKALTEDAAALARRHGAALVDLAVAVRTSRTLSTMEPLV